MGKRFTLYYRENCHLCDSMRQALVALRKQIEFDWVEVDIDRDIDLIRLYDTKVPVDIVDQLIEVGSRRVTRFFLLRMD